MTSQADAVAVRRLQVQLSEVIDECRYVEGQRDEASQRGATMQQALEQLVAYVIALESKVILPALGPLTIALDRFHEARQQRQLGESLAVSVVNSETNPRLAQLLAAMRQPMPETVREADRQRSLQSPSVQAVEDGYVLVSRLLRDSDDLLRTLRAAHEAAAGSHGGASAQRIAQSDGSFQANLGNSPTLGSLRGAVRGGPTDLALSPSRASSAVVPPGSALDHRIQMERLLAENRALQQEVLSERQHSEGALRHAEQEKELFNAKIESSLRQLREAESDRDSLKSKCASAETIEPLYQTCLVERRLLQDRIHVLEEDAARSQQERVVVAQKFQVIQRALTEAQQDVSTLRRRLQVYEGATAAVMDAPLPPETSSMERASPSRYRSLPPIAAAPASLSTPDVSAIALQEEAARLRQQLDVERRETREREAKQERELLAMRRRLLSGQSQAAPAAPPPRAAADAATLPGPDAVFLSKLEKDEPNIKSAPPPTDGGTAAVSAQAKLRALELTVQALNTELATLEDKIVAVESEGVAERSQLESTLVGERQRAERDRQEADTVVAQLSNELQSSMAENAQLRQRLRAVQSQVAGSVR